MSRTESTEPTFERNLSNRHIQMIGLGGAIGTGLFLGSAGVIKSAGPSLLVGYMIAGLIAFLIMRQLGEMLVDEPVSGSLSHFGNKYGGGFMGYLTGWNYTVTYFLVGMAELTALGKYMQFWWPELPTWATAGFFLLLISGINTLNVKIYGESEFWFAIIKVGAVLLMIVMGAWFLFGPHTPPQATIANLWSHGGFMPNGWQGLIMALPLIMFAFGGLEFIGFTAGEAREPGKTIPRAINAVLYRIGLFYVLALAVLLALTPWDNLVASLSAAGDPYSASPFVKILSLLKVDYAAHALNFVVLTAALSVYNAVVYCNSRQLHAMARQGHAPRALVKLSDRRIPINALLLTGLVTAAAVVLNYLSPDGALETLMSLVVATTMMNWALTSVIHLKFRKAKREAGQPTAYHSPLYPLTNYLCIAFIAGLLLIIAFIPGMRISVLLIPCWLLVMAITYQKVKNSPAAIHPVSSNA
ncbi:aromatic amino acid transporter [Pseudomonas sp. LLC-1]|uniref:amino acid permease n=1 Tax=Pseudomonas TaxID=286 RepID=UPI000D015B90|nr:amino acid permease [Pseudomonas sp.]PRN04767.1 aromatic amino acid transporter [Pseudomonas sp. LLC-1]